MQQELAPNHMIVVKSRKSFHNIEVSTGFGDSVYFTSQTSPPINLIILDCFENSMHFFIYDVVTAIEYFVMAHLSQQKSKPSLQFILFSLQPHDLSHISAVFAYKLFSSFGSIHQSGVNGFFHFQTGHGQDAFKPKGNLFGFFFYFTLLQEKGERERMIMAVMLTMIKEIVVGRTLGPIRLCSRSKQRLASLTFGYLRSEHLVLTVVEGYFGRKMSS